MPAVACGVHDTASAEGGARLHQTPRPLDRLADANLRRTDWVNAAIDRDAVHLKARRLQSVRYHQPRPDMAVHQDRAPPACHGAPQGRPVHRFEDLVNLRWAGRAPPRRGSKPCRRPRIVQAERFVRESKRIAIDLKSIDQLRDRCQNRAQWLFVRTANQGLP